MAVLLAKTSNPGPGLQNLTAGDRLVYQLLGDMAERLGTGTEGDYGYGLAGALLGATYPEELRELRPPAHTFFLVPGYGAQGGTAEDVQYAFDRKGRGAVVNASRSIMCAWQKTGKGGPTSGGRPRRRRGHAGRHRSICDHSLKRGGGGSAMAEEKEVRRLRGGAGMRPPGPAADRLNFSPPGRTCTCAPSAGGMSSTGTRWIQRDEESAGRKNNQREVPHAGQTQCTVAEAVRLNDLPAPLRWTWGEKMADRSPAANLSISSVVTPVCSAAPISICDWQGKSPAGGL